LISKSTKKERKKKLRIPGLILYFKNFMVEILCEIWHNYNPDGCKAAKVHLHLKTISGEEVYGAMLYLFMEAAAG
jgi:hypothetical protein